MLTKISKLNYINILGLLCASIIPFLVLGPFFPDLFVTISIIIFLFMGKASYLFESIKTNNILKFLFIFWVYLVISSLFSNDIFFSLKSSFFWIRHLFYSIIIISSTYFCRHRFFFSNISLVFFFYFN